MGLSKSELKQFMIILIKPQNFMHGLPSANLFDPRQKSIKAGWENEKTKSYERFLLWLV